VKIRLSELRQLIRQAISENIQEELIDHVLSHESAVVLEDSDPAKGRGKKPAGSDRRLYTDEDPGDTVRVKFSSANAIKNTLAKKSFKAKSHARQSQIINLIHQRTRTAHGRAKDPKVKARLGRALDYAEERKEASKRKTKRMREREELILSLLERMSDGRDVEICDVT